MLTRKAEWAAARGKMSVIYKTTNTTLCQENQPICSWGKNDGNKLLTESEQAARWVQHFSEALNCPEPGHPATPTLADCLLNTSPPTGTEVKSAIKATKKRKAAGLYFIYAQMLKADIKTSVKVLTDLFKNISKKGNLQNCNNWQSIKLLSIPSKVFCRDFIHHTVRLEHVFSDEPRVIGCFMSLIIRHPCLADPDGGVCASFCGIYYFG